MKFKKKLLFGLISSTAIATSTIGLLTTAAWAPVSNSNTNVTNNNEQNSAYIYLTFITQDPEVTFTGGTSVKIRSGKLFGSVIAPIATKPDSQFQYWYYIDEKGRQQEIKSDTKIDGNMPLKNDKLFIYPLFETITPEAFQVVFEANGGVLESGPSKSPFLAGQTFESIQKPVVSSSKPNESYFIGWYTTKDDSGERILDDFVLEDNISVYAHYAKKSYSASSEERGVGSLLFKRDVSESLNITALSGDVTLTASLEDDKVVAYYWDNDPQNQEGGVLFRDDYEVVIPEGHTICLVSGASRRIDYDVWENRGNYAFSDRNINSFKIFGGEVSLSGTTEGLLDWGDSSTQIDDLTQIPSESYGQRCFSELFYDADDKPDPEKTTKIYLSNDIAYQKRAFLPATTVSFDAYNSMFAQCESITSIPEYFLRGQHLYEGCYSNMFLGCWGIKTIPPTLFGPYPVFYFEHIKDVGLNYFYQMFCDCTGLESVPKFSQFSTIDELPQSCCESMFAGCTSLTSIHENLFSNITKFDERSCSSMFCNCTSLTQIPTLVGCDLSEGVIYAEIEAFAHVFAGCENVTYIDPKFFEWTYYPGMGDEALLAAGSFFGAFSGLTNITIYAQSPEDIPPGAGYKMIIDTSGVWHKLHIDYEFGIEMFAGCNCEGTWKETGTITTNSDFQYWIQVIEK